MRSSGFEPEFLDLKGRCSGPLNYDLEGHSKVVRFRDMESSREEGKMEGERSFASKEVGCLGIEPSIIRLRVGAFTFGGSNPGNQENYEGNGIRTRNLWRDRPASCCLCSIPPWGERRDLPPLSPGPQPGASSPSASPTCTRHDSNVHHRASDTRVHPFGVCGARRTGPRHDHPYSRCREQQLRQMS